ncbi:hypothetical protein AVEN_237029-1 [Araneus ventricosus]|uniref:Uncharacterized protein n=1 Tax=Araneus ventricosus TaxID=182803 RepID=A0A4Y2VS31_ARAVE|nr:hypothetical protein AVEN_237029-1 [Araneus ventricosus]
MDAVSIPGSEELDVLSPSCIEIVQFGDDEVTMPICGRRSSSRDNPAKGKFSNVSSLVRQHAQQQVFGMWH